MPQEPTWSKLKSLRAAHRAAAAPAQFDGSCRRHNSGPQRGRMGESIRVLLKDNGLPTSDLMSSKPQFIVACEGETVVAAGALQCFGASALLRSVAVAPEL